MTTFDSRALVAAVVLGTLGGLTIMAVPGFVMLFHFQAPLTDRQLGFVAAWDINSTAAAIGVSALIISRVNWRVLAFLGTLLIVIGTCCTAASHTYAAIVGSRVCAGLGEGLAIGVSFAALGSAANPDRAFGIYLIVGLVVSAAALALFPILQDRMGAANTFIGLALIAGVSGVLLPWLPRRNPRVSHPDSIIPPCSQVLAVSSLVGVLLYFVAQGATWSYFERIGSASGVPAVAIGQAMAISSFAGGAGSFVAVLLSTKMSRTWPLIASGVISVTSFYILAGHVDAKMLIVAGILFNFGWNLAQPLLSGICAEADAHGRIVCAMGCIQTVGFGAGPALGASVLVDHNFAPIAWLSTGVLLTSLVIVLLGMRAHGRRTVAAPRTV